MDRRAVDQARRALQRAGRRLDDFRNATDIDEAEELWGEFLNAASKVHEKLRAGASGDTESWTWFKKKLDERRDDELLAYMHHARNSDHHRLERVAAIESGPVDIGAVGGRVFINNLSFLPDGTPIGKWTPETPGARLTVKKLPDRLRLVPVIDKGVTYAIPERHRGDPIVPTRDPEKLGRMLLQYYREVLLPEAASLLR